MDPELAIEAKALVMRYGQDRPVLDGLDMRVPRGSVYGLIGRNGVGKTSLIRVLMGLFPPTAGSVSVLGERAFPASVALRQRVGYLSQEQRMFEWMTVAELGRFVAPLYPSWDARYFDELRDGLGLPLNWPLGRLSRGERQKAGLLIALAPRPDLLVLDEPAANLDTVLRREFVDSVLDLLIRDGMTVVLSSHILPDVERLADHIGILAQGQIVLEAPLDALKESIKRVRFIFEADPPAYVPIDEAMSLRRGKRELLLTVRDYAPGVEATWRERLKATAVEVHDVDLEDLFVEYVTMEVAE